MTTPHKFTLTGLLLEFWYLSDRAKVYRNAFTDHAIYRDATLSVTRAAKRLNHEALSRMIRDQPIPYPWEGMGGLEQ
jgi:hypothetical protein